MRQLWVVALLISFGLQIMPAPARDDGRYAASPLKPWFDSLRNGENEGCCSDADGTALADIDWEADAEGYRVRIEGRWWRVPPKAVLTTANRVGRTMVWPVYSREGTKLIDLRVRCFIPGSMT